MELQVSIMMVRRSKDHLLPSALARGSEWGIYSQDVRMYVRKYVSVTLKMSIWGHARNVVALTRRHWYVDYTGTSGRRFLAIENGEDSAAGPLQRTYLAELSAETSAGRSRRVPTLRNLNMQWSQVHRRSQESVQERRFKSEKARIGDSSQARY